MSISNGAYLERVSLCDAYLKNANLQNAQLSRAKNLSPEQIKSACFWDEAIYEGKWNWDEEKWTWVPENEQAKQDNKNYIEELKEDKSSDPKQSPDYSRWQK
ncbi:pentapeptide repeat-containing protein [Myxosarcina sp. GI1(2024)]